MEQQNRESNDDSNFYDLWKVIFKRRVMIIGLFLIIVISTAIVSLFMPKIYRGEVNLVIIDNSTLSNIDSADRKTLSIKQAEGANEIIGNMGSIDDEKKKLILPKTYISVKSVKLKSIKNAAYKISTIIEAQNTDDISLAIAELVDCLNNMENVKANLKEEREILTQRSMELTSIIKSASDSLVTYNNLLQSGKLTIISFNPIEQSKIIADIKLEKIALEKALSRLKNGRIQIITPPNISNKPVSPKTLYNIYIAGLLSLFVGLALAFFMEYIEKINDKKK